MSIKRKVNHYRRKLFQMLTKNIDVTRLGQLETKPEIKRILIIRPNHRLGNLLLITPLVQEINELFPNVKIDLFVKGGLAPILFKNYRNIDLLIQLPKKPFKDLFRYVAGWLALRKHSYDIAINAVSGSSSGKLSTRMVEAKFKFPGDIDEDIKERYPNYKHSALYTLYSFRNYITKLGYDVDWHTIRYLDLKLTRQEIEEGKKILDSLIGSERKSIALYTFATGNKCYSKAWWQTLYERLKNEFPAYNIFEVLPVENVSQLDFKLTSYYSKDIREIGAVIANTSVFICADCGIMHLASAVHTPTVGFFSVTLMEVYEPYNRGSIGINTNETTIDTWIEKIKDSLTMAAPVHEGQV